ncbi:28S ribosomal protein S18c, mitochondrial [Sparganum proliferum]
MLEAVFRNIHPVLLLRSKTSVLPARLLSASSDVPTELTDPYEPPKKKCFLCKNNVDLDYKNVRLLSQFVSPYTGRIYGRHITGLCIPMQKRISQLIKRSRKFGDDDDDDDEDDDDDDDDDDDGGGGDKDDDDDDDEPENGSETSGG